MITAQMECNNQRMTSMILSIHAAALAPISAMGLFIDKENEQPCQIILYNLYNNDLQYKLYNQLMVYFNSHRPDHCQHSKIILNHVFSKSNG